MGIGKQMAYHYARMGARVMTTARSEDRLKKVNIIYLFVICIFYYTTTKLKIVSTALLFLCNA